MTQPVSSLLFVSLSGPWQLWGSTTLSLWVYLDLKRNLPGDSVPKKKAFKKKWLHTNCLGGLVWDLAFFLVWKSDFFSNKNSQCFRFKRMWCEVFGFIYPRNSWRDFFLGGYIEMLEVINPTGWISVWIRAVFFFPLQNELGIVARFQLPILPVSMVFFL